MWTLRALAVAAIFFGIFSSVGFGQGGPAAAPAVLSDAERARRFAFESPRATPFVFSGAKLPRVEFERPDEIRRLIGAYALQITWYDAAYNVVKEAAKPGRYGAVVEIIPADAGKMPRSRRFLTLYRMPEDWRWWRSELNVAIELPKELGVDAKVAQAHAALLNRHIKELFGDSLENKPDGAILLAGLSEATSGQAASFYESPEQRNLAWWLGLTRKLHGLDKLPAKPFACPRPIEGKPAPVLHEGSPAQAGMTPQGVEAIDALLREWAADSDEGFNVVIARRGVIVLDKAYGQRDGKPMTPTTRSELASMTKMITGVMMLTLIDQGVIDLDKPITALPGPLQGLATSQPLTLRHLYTHTAGFPGDHWGDQHPDMEERVATLLPHLPIGKAYLYSAMDMALAWKLAGGLTGQTMGQFARRHLLEPLGCKDTELGAAGYRSTSTARDLARICQMVLNRGAYGPQRFFSESSYPQLLPRNLKYLLNSETTQEYGLGTSWLSGGGLGGRAFAHGAASNMTARVDPDQELVLVMCRNAGGANFEKYHPRFLKAVADAMGDRIASIDELLTMKDCAAPVAAGRVEVSKAIRNSASRALVIEHEFLPGGGTWAFTPAKGTLTIPPGGEAVWKVTGTFDPRNPTPLPAARGDMRFADQKPFAYEFAVRPILRRQARAVRLAKAPTPDGRIDPGEYGSAEVQTGFVLSNGSGPSPVRTEFHVGYDDKAVYLGIIAHETGAAERTQVETKRDAGAWEDDCIDTFIDAAHDRAGFKQFLVSAANVQIDAAGDGKRPFADLKWNAQWQSSVKAYADRWVYELAIPYEALSVAAAGSPAAPLRPKPGDVWGFNLCRNRRLPAETPVAQGLSQWNVTFISFQTPGRFGDLVFE